MKRATRRGALTGVLGAGLSGLASRLQAQPRPAPEPRARLALVGGELRRPPEPPLHDSVLVIDGDSIDSVGTDEAAARGITTVDVRGKVVTAGLIDAVTQIGLVEIDLEETSRTDSLHTSDPVRAAFRAADGYDPASSLVRVARLGGVTTVAVVPRGGLVSGQSAWADLDGDTAGQAIANPSLALHVQIDDATLGGLGHGTATALLRLRELFDDAATYRRNRAAFERNQLRELGASRLDLETLVRTLEGTLPVVFHVDRASDMLAVLALSGELGLRPVLASAAEAWKVAPALARAKVPVVVYPLDDGPRSFAALGAREDNAALLHRAGVAVALSAPSSHDTRKLRQVAGNAVRAGLPAEAALAGVTHVPAAALGMGARYGVPKRGQVANLVVWSGDPFELSTRAEAIIIRGERVSLRSRQTTLFERYR